MKVNLDQKLYDFTGDTFKLGPNTDDLTLSDVIILAVKTPTQEDATLTMLQKLDLAKIGKAVYMGLDEFSTEQVTMIKERVCKTLNAPALALAVNEAIENVPPMVPKTKAVAETPVVTSSVPVEVPAEPSNS